MELVYESLAVLGRKLPWRALQIGGAAFGRLLWRSLPERRRYASQAVARHLPVVEEEARRIARESFVHTGRAFAELLGAYKVDWRFFKDRVSFDHPERLEYLQRTTRPVVLATAHFGAWEPTAGLLRLLVPGKPRLLLGRRIKNMHLNRVVEGMRNRPGVRYATHRGAVPAIMRVLRSGGVFGTLVDHNCSYDEALFLPFLGEPAAVNRGPALVAVRGKAVVLPATMAREEEGRYRVLMGPPLDTTKLEGEREERIRYTAAHYTRWIEEIVRTYPEQWLWMHKRWKTKPRRGDRTDMPHLADFPDD